MKFRKLFRVGTYQSSKISQKHVKIAEKCQVIKAIPVGKLLNQLADNRRTTKLVVSLADNTPRGHIFTDREYGHCSV